MPDKAKWLDQSLWAARSMQQKPLFPLPSPPTPSPLPSCSWQLATGRRQGCVQRLCWLRSEGQGWVHAAEASTHSPPATWLQLTTCHRQESVLGTEALLAQVWDSSGAGPTEQTSTGQVVECLPASSVGDSRGGASEEPGMLADSNLTSFK